jgi:hypothetical protein
MNLAADVIAQKSLPRLEQDMSEAAEKAFETDMPIVQATMLLEMLGKFEHEKAHDVLADSVVKFVQTHSAANPVAAQGMVQAVTSLERAYTREVRPEGKARILTAYAAMCIWVSPPPALASLMPDLNASLEKITGENVKFLSSDEPVMQKLALLEWVEKLVRDKKIPKRPAMPSVIEETVKDFMEAPPVVAPPTMPGAPAAAAPAAPAGPIAPPPAP